MTLKKLKNGKWQVRWRDSQYIQRAKNFLSKELAQEFLRALHRGETDDRARVPETTLGEIIDDWRKVRYPGMGHGTRIRYDNLIRLHLEEIKGVRIRELTPVRIDAWIEAMKADLNRYGREAIRTGFKHEVAVLKTVLGFYLDYRDDPHFVMPVKRRHFVAAKLRNRPRAAPKNLGEGAFQEFCAQLGRDYGAHIAALAALQFHQALRISEAVALTWADIEFDWKSPRRSRISFSQHAIYTRIKGAPDFLEPGLKNDDVGKEHPMLPPVFEALKGLWRPGARGLVFTPPKGSPLDFFSYRQVQYRYNRTFKKLELPFRSTHVMRHGGTRKTFDETGGDMGVAQQQLGNRDRKTVEVYAQRSAGAFTEYADGQWDAAERVSASGVHGAPRRLEIVKDNK